MDTMPSTKKKNQSTSILIFSVALVILVAIIITQDMSAIKTFIERSGTWGIVISIVLYAVLGVTLVPSEPLTVFIGALFGPLIAILVAGTGNTLSSLVEYYLGTHVANVTNFIEKKEQLPWGLSKVKVDSPLFLIGARMVPGVGPKFVSITAGIYHVPIPLYLWTSAVSVFLGAVVFALGGSGLGSIFAKK